MTVEQLTTITIDDLDRLILTCKSCGHGQVIPLRSKSYPHPVEFTVGEDVDCAHCRRHWWGRHRKGADGSSPPPSGTHLPPLLRALIEAARHEGSDVSLGLVVTSEVQAAGSRPDPVGDRPDRKS